MASSHPPQAPTPAGPEHAHSRTLLFRVGTTVYGCDIDVVREIIPYRAATRLPGAPAYVRGLINLRGTLVTVVDLGVRLRPDRTPAQDGSIIIVAVDNHVAGLAVDEVMDVRLVRPESTQGEGESIVRNLGHLEGTVVILVDVPVLVREVLV